MNLTVNPIDRYGKHPTLKVGELVLPLIRGKVFKMSDLGELLALLEQLKTGVKKVMPETTTVFTKPLDEISEEKIPQVVRLDFI